MNSKIKMILHKSCPLTSFFFHDATGAALKDSSKAKERILNNRGYLLKLNSSVWRKTSEPHQSLKIMLLALKPMELNGSVSMARSTTHQSLKIVLLTHKLMRFKALIVFL